MPDNENSEVFNRLAQTRAAKEVPAPGKDNHATIDGNNSVWNGITNTPYIKNLSGGQEQHLVLSADHVVQVQHNQIIKIWQAPKYNRATGDDDYFGGKPDSSQSLHADRPGSRRKNGATDHSMYFQCRIINPIFFG
jgi:hypothetical protein